jgi:rSAM/selenodomain-associated transferase 2
LRVSIIVPALDEVRGIAATLAPLQPLRADGHEVIVVDGGSSDATLAVAAPLADRAFVAARGRALQMNAGAAKAGGDVLLFLHADSRLDASAICALTREMTRSGRRWGRFDVTIAGRSRVLPLVAAMMNARSRLTGIATGDQGIFVERALFNAVGGFPDQALMEDVELSKRLKRAAGPPLCLTDRVATSYTTGRAAAVSQANDRGDVAMALPIGVMRRRPVGRRIPDSARGSADSPAGLRQSRLRGA